MGFHTGPKVAAVCLLGSLDTYWLDPGIATGFLNTVADGDVLMPAGEGDDGHVPRPRPR
jgi:hypothetical protein